MGLPRESEVFVDSNGLNGGLERGGGAGEDTPMLVPLVADLIKGTVLELMLPLLFIVYIASPWGFLLVVLAMFKLWVDPNAVFGSDLDSEYTSDVLVVGTGFVW